MTERFGIETLQGIEFLPSSKEEGTKPQIKPSPFRNRKKNVPDFLTKDLSHLDETRGGALVPPPEQKGEVRRVQDNPYQIVLFSDGKVRVSSGGSFRRVDDRTAKIASRALGVMVVPATDSAPFDGYTEEGIMRLFGGKSIGRKDGDPKASALERAKHSDLITLPDGVEGTNCGNCKWIENAFCNHPQILLPVNERMCCALWDAPGTKRAWEQTSENGVKGSYFAECERDDEGRCLPSGQQGEYSSEESESEMESPDEEGKYGIREIEPDILIPTEEHSGVSDAVRDRFPEGETLPPIVLRVAPGKKEILDGHNRVLLAEERGEHVPYVQITEEEYRQLEEMGYEQMQIAYAVLYLEGEYDEASNMDNALGGFLGEKGREAAAILEGWRMESQEEETDDYESEKDGKSFHPPQIKPSPFRNRQKSLKASYFETCERDDEGRCLPSGQQGEEKPKRSGLLGLFDLSTVDEK